VPAGRRAERHSSWSQFSRIAYRSVRLRIENSKEARKLNAGGFPSSQDLGLQDLGPRMEKPRPVATATRTGLPTNHSFYLLNKSPPKQKPHGSGFDQGFLPTTSARTVR